jgi:hypothetical protein
LALHIGSLGHLTRHLACTRACPLLLWGLDSPSPTTSCNHPLSGTHPVINRAQASSVSQERSGFHPVPPSSSTPSRKAH